VLRIEVTLTLYSLTFSIEATLLAGPTKRMKRKKSLRRPSNLHRHQRVKRLKSLLMVIGHARIVMR
jgi:hypothetical protein